jgi:DNA-binding NtrC family response regulator
MKTDRELQLDVQDELRWEPGVNATGRGYMGQPLPGEGARILLVNEDARELLRYRTILEKLGCDVRVRSSFAKGVQCLGDQPFDLIFLDQGSSKFEGLEVLARAMEIDAELRVLVTARSYDAGCCFKAMHSGALDYLEAPLTAMQIFGLLDMFVPRRSRAQRASANRGKSCEESTARSAASQAGCRIEHYGMHLN